MISLASGFPAPLIPKVPQLPPRNLTSPYERALLARLNRMIGPSAVLTAAITAGDKTPRRVARKRRSIAP